MIDDSQLVFIVSSGRAGTTLVRKLLQPDERISVSPELRFFDGAYPWRTLLTRDRAAFTEKVIQALKSSNDPLYEENQVDYNFLREQISDQSDIAKIFTTLLRHTGTHPNASMFVEKTGRNIFYLEPMAQLFPQAQFLHVYRDGREFCASAKKMGRSRELEPLAAYWCESIRRFHTFKQRHADRCLEISYEALTQDTPKVYSELYAFLKLVPHADLSDVVQTVTPSSSFAERNTTTGIYQSKNFAKYFSDSEQKVLTFYLHDTLRERGYPVQNVLAPRLRSRARFWRSLYGLRLQYFLKRSGHPALFRWLKQVF